MKAPGNGGLYFLHFLKPLRQHDDITISLREATELRFLYNPLRQLRESLTTRLRGKPRSV